MPKKRSLHLKKNVHRFSGVDEKGDWRTPERPPCHYLRATARIALTPGDPPRALCGFATDEAAPDLARVGTDEDPGFHAGIPRSGGTSYPRPDFSNHREGARRRG